MIWIVVFCLWSGLNFSLERPALIEPLCLVDILIRRSADAHQEVASKVILCLARLLEFDEEQGIVARRLHERKSC